MQNLNTISANSTIGSIICSAAAYKSACSVKKYARLYTSCIHPPLFTGEDSERILDICAPPQLHLMQGIVKHIYDKMFKDWKGVSLWLAKIHIKQKKVSPWRFCR